MKNNTANAPIHPLGFRFHVWCQVTFSVNKPRKFGHCVEFVAHEFDKFSYITSHFQEAFLRSKLTSDSFQEGRNIRHKKVEEELKKAQTSVSKKRKL